MALLLSQRRYPRWLPPILALLVLGGCGGGHPQKHPRPQPGAKGNVTVTVRLDQAIAGRHSASGFLHALAPGAPPDRLVVPLRPRFWRSDLSRASLTRAVRLGARYEVVLSDFWGYHQGHRWAKGPPWAHLRRWSALVRRVARSLRGRRVLFDVWNEPDDPGFFGGGLRRFLRVYAAAKSAVERELGTRAEIGGPSTSHYLPHWFSALVRCCRPSFLSWHATDSSVPTAAVRRQLLATRRAFGARRPLQINEFGSPGDRYRPGETVGYLAAIESGGADAAARACWSQQDCSPGGFDALLTQAGEPRAAWWAQRWYALTPPEARVEAQASDGRVSVLASRGTPRRVLLGQAERSSHRAVAIELVVHGLRGGAAHVTIERLPDAGAAAVPRPQRVADMQLKLDQGTARVRVPELGPHEAALVTLDVG